MVAQHFDVSKHSSTNRTPCAPFSSVNFIYVYIYIYISHFPYNSCLVGPYNYELNVGNGPGSISTSSRFRDGTN